MINPVRSIPVNAKHWGERGRPPSAVVVFGQICAPKTTQPSANERRSLQKGGPSAYELAKLRSDAFEVLLSMGARSRGEAGRREALGERGATSLSFKF